MDSVGWRQAIGEMVRENMRSPQIQYYFSVKTTKPRGSAVAQAAGSFCAPSPRLLVFPLRQLSTPVKRKILEHEYGEVIKDEYTEHGHLDLIVRQEK